MDQIVERQRLTKEQVVDGSFSFLNGYECVFVCCKFMLLKKLVVLHLCDLIHNYGQANFLFVVVFMIFGDGGSSTGCIGVGIQGRSTRRRE